MTTTDLSTGDINSEKVDNKSSLVSWVIEQSQPWTDYRKSNFEDKWDEYYRLFRGIWAAADKSRDSERSKLIAPDLQQAIEMAVSEQEEATFGKGRWFDLEDDLVDQAKEEGKDIEAYRNLLLEDLNLAQVPSVISEIFLNGALYGTGIGKIVIEEVEDKSISQGSFEAESKTGTKIQVKLVAIHPEEFAIDTAARTIDEALGCTHTTIVPKHRVVAKQKSGVYRNVKIGGMTDSDLKTSEKDELSDTSLDTKVKVMEYHGLIPRHLLEDIEERAETLEEALGIESTDLEDADLVEAIVTIANDSILLRAVENPFLMGDRCFIAYQHDTIPNRFWGRGVAEKGYNSQKALDAELRGRIDAMALSIHPMMGVDATRIPRGGDLSVRPGKNILVNGDPATVLRPFNFGQVNPTTFTQSGELGRMVQMATGSMDSATPIGQSPRNQTASGMSMISAGAVKRSKRTLSNITRSFLSPFIHKAAWRYMQFDPERYPAIDVKFVVHSTLGIMARELEQQQLSGLLNTTKPDSPGYWMLISSIYENSSISNREEMMNLAKGLLEQSINPQPDPMQQQMMMLEMEAKAKELQKTESEIVLNVANANATMKNQPDGSSKESLDAQIKVLMNREDNATILKKAMIDSETKKVIAFNTKDEPKEKTEEKEPKNKSISFKREGGKIVGVDVKAE